MNPGQAVTLHALPQETSLRSSHQTQIATARAVLDVRDIMVTEWADWLHDRSGSRVIPRPLVERQFKLIIDNMVEMMGPLRREAEVVWRQVTEHYGRIAAARGLSAGEVVEELQELRVLLIKHIGGAVAAMRPRRALTVFLRLNAIIDRGIAMAVVGYTDALVASLLMTDRNQQALTETNAEDLGRQLNQLEAELTTVSAKG